MTRKNRAPEEKARREKLGKLLPVFAVDGSSRPFSRRASSSGLRFFLDIVMVSAIRSSLRLRIYQQLWYPFILDTVPLGRSLWPASAIWEVSLSANSSVSFCSSPDGCLQCSGSFFSRIYHSYSTLISGRCATAAAPISSGSFSTSRRSSDVYLFSILSSQF